MGFDLATAKPAEAGGFDLSTAKPVDSDPKAIPGNTPAPAPAPEAKADWFDKIRGGIDAGGTMLTNLVGGTIGQVGGTLGALAGQVRQGELGDPEAGARAASVAQDASHALTTTPKTAQGQSQLETVGRALKDLKLEGLPMADMQLLANVGRSTPAVLQKGESVARAVARAAASGPEADLVRKGAEKVGAAGRTVVAAGRTVVDAGRDVIGTRAKEATKQAGGAAKGAVEGAAGELEKQAGHDAQRVKALGDVQRSMEAKAVPPAPPASLDVQGGQIRESFTKAMEDAKKNRAEVADLEFGQVKAMAAEQEARGARVDTAAIERTIEEAIAEASGITDLEAGLNKMLTAVRGAPEKKGAAPKAPELKGATLLDEIQRKGGIDIKEILDITGEGRAGEGVKGLRPNLFKKDGKGLDELATALREEGWDIPPDSVDGGVQALRNMIRDEMDGRPNYNFADQQRMFEQQQAARDAAARGEEAPKGKTFEQLELARRYLNDIGYSSELEGYPAILRGQARKIAGAIDKAMQDFVPEFKVYKDNYRVLSEPLESATTRFGKAVTTTEGGLAETAYSKVANADLPARLFARKEGVELLVDALAGGKNAAPEVRAAAQAKVEKMVESWVLESVRQKSPTAALEHLSSPQMRGTLSSVPNIEAALKKQFGDIAGMDKTAKDLVKIGKELSERGENRQAAAQKLKTSISMADTMAAQPGKTSQKKAYDAYVKALQAARRDGLVPQAEYEATMGMIDRAATLEEKTTMARRILAGVSIIGVGGAKALHYLGM